MTFTFQIPLSDYYRLSSLIWFIISAFFFRLVLFVFLLFRQSDLLKLIEF